MKRKFKLEQIKARINSLQNNSDIPEPWTHANVRYFFNLLAELNRRDRETLNHYTPLPAAIPFHYCRAHRVALSGSNRGGKTCTASAEVAMCALHRHYLPDKYHREDVRIACVGADGKHLALMFEYLFEKPPYKIFMHPDTKKWTVVIPDQHQQYKHLWQDADPLIPQRYLHGGSYKTAVLWESEKGHIPKEVRLTNGTVIKFYSALGKIPKGIKFDLIWIDEEIERAGRWIKEMQARIIDRNGYILWSATPQLAGQDFFDIEIQAGDPDNKLKPLAQQRAFFVMLSHENFYLDSEGREAFFETLKNDADELMTRYFGKSARSLLIAYPEFQIEKHVVKPVTMRYYDCRYPGFDPGTSEAGILMCMSPEQIEDEEEIAKLTEQERWYRTRPGCIVVYDECLIKNANANMVAEKFKELIEKYPEKGFQDLTIDEKGSKAVVWKGMKVQENPGTIYKEAIQRTGLVPYDCTEDKDWQWKYGSNDVDYGIARTKDYLCIAPDGLPRIFVTENCERLIYQLQSHRKTRDHEGNFTGYEKGNKTLLDILRYITTRGIQWIPAPLKNPKRAYSVSDFRATLKDVRSGKMWMPRHSEE